MMRRKRDRSIAAAAGAVNGRTAENPDAGAFGVMGADVVAVA